MRFIVAVLLLHGQAVEQAEDLMPHPAAAPTRTLSYWIDSASMPVFPRLHQDHVVDVVVVGGGITGLTAAYLLQRDGQRVALLERNRCAQVDTAYTTAHLTMVTDERLSRLVERFGRDHAQAVWDAGLAALSQIDDIVRAEGIECGFEWVAGYLHLPRQGNRADGAALQEDAALAADMGFDAAFVDQVPLMSVPGIQFDSQARFHPRQYLAGVANAIREAGGDIFEHSAADEFSNDPLAVRANGHTIRCNDIVLATHNPLVGVSNVVRATAFQTKLALYTSYVVAGRVPHGSVPDALFWDTADPYRYLRLEPHRDFDLVIFGGEDHKTGQAGSPAECHRHLEEQLTALIPGVDITYRWSGQVIETPDGLPYIGQMAPHQYAGTGFAGNGMTFGTLSGMMSADAILERSNPWVDLFDPGRKAIRHGAWEYIKENADYPYYLIRDRFAGAEGRSLRTVKRGSGQVIERDGRKVAAYRDDDGRTTFRSATCTHMGCIVGWNDAERTWDCPCHGSRFTPTGEVLSGPAETPLEEVE
jgi:glycine/D-amino acid oxidase-like deaminating enzyme/nitrite reductase/ring-hydroxylating ferredoxin subunit